MDLCILLINKIAKPTNMDHLGKVPRLWKFNSNTWPTNPYRAIFFLQQLFIYMVADININNARFIYMVTDKNITIGQSRLHWINAEALVVAL